MVNLINNAKNKLKGSNQSWDSSRRISLALVVVGILFVLSAVIFCPITQAALAKLVLPFFIGLKVNIELVSHLAFFSLLLIGLHTRPKQRK